MDYRPENEAELQIFLREIGLIAQQWQYQEQQYFLIGDKFLSQIMFMGCAPSIEFEPQDDHSLPANLVAISLPEFLSESIFYPSEEDFQYRCPACKQLTGPLPKKIINQDSEFHCQSCGKSFSYQKCNWRHQAGTGRCFIEVMGIFPQEAIPSSGIMEQLKKFSGVPWGYFYAKGKS